MKGDSTSIQEEKKPPRFGISRRAFLKLSALTGAAATVSCATKNPDILTPEEKTEGVVTEKWVPTSCLNCPARCATKVRVVNGKAVKITGNPLSQASEGKTCPRAQIGLQVLYDPDRVSTPLKRMNPTKGKGVDPQWTPISWRQALDEIGGRLKALRNQNEPHKLALFCGLNTTSSEDMIHRFADAYGTPNVISADGFESEAEKSGGWMSDGHYEQSAYDLGQTNYILSFGASILESQTPLVRLLRMWGKMRREKSTRSKVVVVDPRYSITAAKADEWIPINPGTDAALAMAIANVLISEDLHDKDFVETWAAGFDEYKQLALDEYSPNKVASITGIRAETIQRIAREFARTKPAIAWRGRGATSRPGGTYASYAIYCLNALVGSIDAPGGVIYQENPQYREMPGLVEDSVAKAGKAKPCLDLRHTAQFPAAEVVTNQVPDSITSGTPYSVDMAIGFNANFSMSAPGTERWDEALKEIPYYIHISPFPSEMAAYADILLPTGTFLEEWGYDHSPPGSGFAELKIKQPAVEPIHDTQSIIDIVFKLATRAGGSVERSFAGIGDDAKGFVKYRTGVLINWGDFRRNGVWKGPAYEYRKYDRIFNTPSKKFEFYSGNLKALSDEEGERAYLPHYEPAKFLGDEADYPLVLTTYRPVMNIQNGSQNYPWAQEIFLVMHGRGWNNFVEVNSETAKANRFRDGDMVWVESQFGKIKAKARVIEGIHPGVVSIASGQGHYAYGEWQKGIGVNPNEIIGVDYDRISGQSALYNTRVKVYKE